MENGKWGWTTIKHNKNIKNENEKWGNGNGEQQKHKNMKMENMENGKWEMGIDTITIETYK